MAVPCSCRAFLLPKIKKQRVNTFYTLLWFLFSIFKKIRPIRIFSVEDFFLFLGQLPRIIWKQIENLLFVEAKKPLANNIRVIYPPNQVIFIFLVEIFLHGLSLLSVVCWITPKFSGSYWSNRVPILVVCVPPTPRIGLFSAEYRITACQTPTVTVAIMSAIP